LAADRDRVDAMTQLGKMYSVGLGLPNGPDYTKAGFWLEKASKRGDAEAKYQLALLLKEGHGLNGSLARIVDLLRDSANLRNAKAMNLLGEFYRDGTGVPTSYDQAVSYFEEARKVGNADACANLGVLYINGGQGVEKNPVFGVKLIREGADQNSPLAFYYYALCFDKGIGQPGNAPNLEQAKIWYIKAARAHYRPAIEWCEKKSVAF